jgi:hypothetical protein
MISNLQVIGWRKVICVQPYSVMHPNVGKEKKSATEETFTWISHYMIFIVYQNILLQLGIVYKRVFPAQHGYILRNLLFLAYL